MKEETLKQIRLERPTQVINEVLAITYNEYGFYNVKVDMETIFLDTKIQHTICILPFPLSDYNKLTEKEQLEWRLKNE